MRTSALVTALIAPLALAACDRGDEATDTTDMPMTAQDMPMNTENMPMAQSGGMGRMANAEGTVTAIDDETGTITIDHGPVAAVDWPAMAMAFEADDAFRQQVAVGDEVEFAFRMTDGGGEITSISKK